jgi:predicted secreted Zn-dependent protease
MAGKGKVTVKNEGVKVVTYKVSGKTLAEIWDDIKAKGPKDDGKHRAGFTKAPVVTPDRLNFDSETTTNKAGETEMTVWIKSAEIKMKAEIKLPKLASDKDLSPKAKAEWKRFMKELREHEDEHVETTEKEAKAIAKEFSELTGTGAGKDKKVAAKEAQADFVKNFKASFGGNEVDQRLKKVNKALDSGGHGPVLDTSIP